MAKSLGSQSLLCILHMCNDSNCVLFQLKVTKTKHKNNNNQQENSEHFTQLSLHLRVCEGLVLCCRFTERLLEEASDLVFAMLPLPSLLRSVPLQQNKWQVFKKWFVNMVFILISLLKRFNISSKTRAITTYVNILTFSTLTETSHKVPSSLVETHWQTSSKTNLGALHSKTEGYKDAKHLY